MRANKFIKKLRFFALVSFFIPLITINICVVLYDLIGSFEGFANLDWSNKKIELKPKDYEKDFLRNEYINSLSLTNCPIYVTKHYAVTDENQVMELQVVADDDKKFVTLLKKNKIKSVFLEQGNVKEESCVKNYKISYFLLKNIVGLEDIVIKAKKDNKSGFTKIKNPYFYGEVSISRTARYYPATYIFKPFIILSSILLFFYWKNNLNLFNSLESNNILANSSKTFFIFGSLSCLFLILHASFLGIDLESKLFLKIRRLIIILFIIFEICAQVFLIKNLYKLKAELKNYINFFILKVKICFVLIACISTFVIFLLLIFGNISGSMKHIVEWNYFSILLFYYLLSFFLLKNLKGNN